MVDRQHRRQTVIKAVLTFDGAGDASVVMSPSLIGRALGAHFVHTTGTALATITFLDSNGFDVLDGLGIVLGSSADLSLFHNDIGGNPVNGDITAAATNGTENDVITCYLYIEGDGPRQFA